MSAGMRTMPVTGSLLTADPHEIPEMPVDTTVLDGDVVHERRS